MRSRFLLLVGVLVAAGFVVGTGGVSSIGADRGVTVATANDENAYMALSEPNDQPIAVSEGEPDELVSITNKFGESVEFEIIEVTADNGVSATIDSGNPSPSQGSTDTWTVNVELTCDDSSATGEITTDVSYHVTADGNSVYVETTDPRTVEYDVTCESST